MQLLARHTGKVRWQFRSDLGRPGLLFDKDGLRLQEWLERGLARVVKQGQHRVVYRVILPELDFHLKYYPLNNARAFLRQVVRPSKARSEYERTLTVAQRGVPTLEPLAYGECGRAVQASYLISRTLPDVCSLDTFLETGLLTLPMAQQRELRRSLAVLLGQFVARMHHAGIVHHDLHPGNLLFRLDPDLKPRLFLIDLHAIQLRSTLNWPSSRDNLVLFNRWFILRADRAERLRFFTAYRRCRAELDRSVFGFRFSVFGNWFLPKTENRKPKTNWVCPADAERDVEQRTIDSNLVFWRRHDPRCTARNRYFQRIRAGRSVRGHAVADLDPVFLRAILADPDAPFHQPGSTILKDSPSSTVIETEISGPDGVRKLIYKRFNSVSWSRPWRSLFRGTPALRSYQMGHALRWRGLPTPRPLLVLHRLRHGLPVAAYLLTEKLPDCRHLLDYLNQPPNQKPGNLRPLIDRLANLIQQLHARRMSHRDLKAPNILVSSQSWKVMHPDRPDLNPQSSTGIVGGPHLWLVDLVGVSRHAHLSQGARVKNLMRLHVSFHAHPALTRTDRLRFLRAYLGWGLQGKAGWKVWWRQIREAALSKIARNQRSGRPLA